MTVLSDRVRQMIPKALSHACLDNRSLGCKTDVILSKAKGKCVYLSPNVLVIPSK